MGDQRDSHGLTISTNSAEAAAAYREGIERMLASSSGGDSRFEAALAADPAFALAASDLALLRLAQGRILEARDLAARATAAAAGATRREQQHTEGVRQATAAPAPAAIETLRVHLLEYPRDAVVLRQILTMILFSGGATKKEAAKSLLDALEPHYGADDWFFLGTSALYYQDLDLLDEARRRAERALLLYPRNAAAAHSLAHVFFETADHAGGSEFLRGWLPGYDPHAPLYCHNHWHLALHELVQGHTDRVHDLYDNAIFPSLAVHRSSFYDAVSLLWRLQLYGCADGPLPWAALQERAKELTAQPGFVFNDLHAAFAHAAAGDGAALSRLINTLRGLAAKGHPTAGAIGVPLAEAIQAFGAGDYAATVDTLLPLDDGFVAAGGSNAQREVFEDTLLHACLRAGRWETAEAILRRRLARRPSPFDTRWLAEAKAARSETAPASGQLAAAP